MTAVSSDPPSFAARLWLSFVCWFRILFDADVAARVQNALHGAPEPVAPLPAPVAPPVEKKVVAPEKTAPQPSAEDGALQLLGLLQREGRLVDFLQQDVTGFGDADVAAAARVVHEGCRKALKSHAEVVSLRSEAEGSRVEVSANEVRDVKLLGNVSGQAPYRGVLRHRGWRVDSLKLPARVGEQDARVVAAAEVEL